VVGIVIQCCVYCGHCIVAINVYDVWMSVVYQYCLLRPMFVVVDMLCMNVVPVVYNVRLRSMFCWVCHVWMLSLLRPILVASDICGVLMLCLLWLMITHTIYLALCTTSWLSWFPQRVVYVCQSHLPVHLYMCILSCHVVTSVVIFIKLGVVEGEFV